MKTRDTDIQTIRALLDRYYDGTGTPDDERRLREFFASCDRSKLPSDMQADAAMLSTLNDADDRLAMTADTDKITKTYLSAAASATTGRKRRNKFMLLWSPAAAAVIAFVAATVFVLTEPKSSCPTDSAATEPAMIAATDPYIEIDSPEEADRLLNEAFTLIGKRMAFAQKTVSKSGGKIDKTNLTVKNILKNEKI